MKQHLAWLPLLFVSACSMSRDDCPEGAMCSTSDDASTAADSAEPGPVFLSLESNVAAITQGESVELKAVVTDPDGIDDVVGGYLTATGDEDRRYGAFTSVAQNGSYELSLSWKDINLLEPIEFVGTSSQRSFTAIFFDAAGHSAKQTISLDLICAQGGCCEGSCMALDADLYNCGACGTTCLPALDSCEQGQCVTQLRSDIPKSCDEVCSAEGFTCTASCEGATGDPFAAYAVYHDSSTSNAVAKTDTSCSAAPPNTYQGADFFRMLCCCH